MTSKKLPQFVISLLTIISLLWSSQPALAAPYDDFKFGTPDRIDVNLEASYGKTDGNFEKTGNQFSKLPNGYSFQTYDMTLGARAEIAPRFHLYASSEFASAESQTLSFGPPTQTKTNGGFTSGTVGTDWVMASGKMLLIPDFSFTYPFDKTERLSGSKVPNHEGVMEGTGRLIFRVERRGYRWGGFGGLTYRDGGRSTVIPWGFLGELTFGRWNFGADARGYQSVNYDKDTDRESAIENVYFCPVQGCSKRFAAFNPSKMTSNLWMRVNPNNEFSFHVGVSQDWGGSNVSRDAYVYGGIIYRLNFNRVRKHPAPEAPVFEESTEDGVDQTPFQTQPSKPAVPTINLQEELNKTEMQMNQKSNKNTGGN